MSRIEVENCWECPFGDVDPYDVCRRARPTRFLEEDARTRTPSWCPLRSGDITVSLRTGKEADGK